MFDDVQRGEIREPDDRHMTSGGRDFGDDARRHRARGVDGADGTLEQAAVEKPRQPGGNGNAPFGDPRHGRHAGHPATPNTTDASATPITVGRHRKTAPTCDISRHIGNFGRPRRSPTPDPHRGAMPVPDGSAGTVPLVDAVGGFGDRGPQARHGLPQRGDGGLAVEAGQIRHGAQRGHDDLPDDRTRPQRDRTSFLRSKVYAHARNAVNSPGHVPGAPPAPPPVPRRCPTRSLARHSSTPRQISRAHPGFVHIWCHRFTYEALHLRQCSSRRKGCNRICTKPRDHRTGARESRRP